MAIKLYVVHGSHPCAAVQRALELKGLDHKLVEWPPAVHAAAQKLKFGRRTVPAAVLESGEKISGSRAIMRRLEEIAPEPALYPTGDERTAVLRAEEWGDQVWQPIARRLLWPAFALAPTAMASYQPGSQLPAFPLPVLKAIAPVMTRVERRLNDAADPAVRADLRSLHAHLDRIDGWIADGVLGGDRVNAADLQIGATTRLLLTVRDVAAGIEDRPAARHALDLWPDWAGTVPAGTYPASWLGDLRAGAA